MKRFSSDRTGVLIVRLWIEANHDTGLRARITQTLDAQAEQSVAVAASADDICAVVKQWVEAFASPGSPNGDSRTATGGNGRATSEGDGRAETLGGGS